VFAFRWRIRRLVRQLDNAAGEWIGWSRLPLGIEPVPADPLVCWCIRCGSSVGTGEATETGCHRCRNRDLPFSEVVRLGCLEAELRSLLLGLKYSGWWEVAQPLGRMLADRLRPVLGNSLHTSVIVPMPMPAGRRLVRGIDHAGLLASAIGKQLNRPVCRELKMARCRPQAAVGFSERSRAPLGRIRLRVHPYFNASRSLRGRTIVLVDDILTSGRTSMAAAGCLNTLQPSRLILAVGAVRDGKTPRWTSWNVKKSLSGP